MLSHLNFPKLLLTQEHMLKSTVFGWSLLEIKTFFQPWSQDPVASAVKGEPELLEQLFELRCRLCEKLLRCQKPGIAIVLRIWGFCIFVLLNIISRIVWRHLIVSFITSEFMTSSRKASSSWRSLRVTVSVFVVSTFNIKCWITAL